ncbi:MAG: DUF2585 family protein [Acidobacteriota bacterium]|nr:MAG: DUF2585 family protein [Acidobacteriota bacterium]
MGQERRTALVGIAITAGMLLLLAAMGRTWWCACGSPVPWSFDVWSSHNSQHLVDPYSLSHFLHGLVFYAALWPLGRRLSLRTRFLLALGIEAGWEVLENTPMVIERYRAVTMSLDYYGDSIVNSLGDVLCFLPGWWVAARARVRVSVALFVATELLTAVWIRDGLVLNVIMLLWPLDAIRDWQMAGLTGG